MSNTLSIYASAASGSITSGDGTPLYPPARNGTGDSGRYVALEREVTSVGQYHDLLSSEIEVIYIYLVFDLSGLTQEQIESANLQLWIPVDRSHQDFTVEARAFNWGGTLTATDFVPGDNLSDLSLLASAPTAGLALNSYITLTENGTNLRDAIAAALADKGILRLLLCSSRTVSNEGPVSGMPEYIGVRMPASAGTDQDPKLVITTASNALGVINAALAGSSGHVLSESDGNLILSFVPGTTGAEPTSLTIHNATVEDCTLLLDG